ncbi:MAG: FAD-binding protein, partial [Flavobacteriales bacterium]|nr:FAD-binding protein [Flavobacteriales bacterium]
KQIAAQKSGIDIKSIKKVNILRRSIDARHRKVLYNLKVQILQSGDDLKTSGLEIEEIKYQNVQSKNPVIIIGAGPAGLFAGLKCLELGLKPIILERGKTVRDRRRDLARLNKEHIVNPESNYCFGEGGAGTYSDGKLYTRSKKRGDVKKILHVLVQHGAKNDILIDAHPHIGTNKLPQIIENIRATIIDYGGEVHFETKVVDFLLNGDSISGVEVQDGSKVLANKVILATGHSARDIFHLLHEKSIKIEPKPFALGVRVEHPQALIDQIQYSCETRGAYLPAAAYNVVQQVGDRGVYSFCMCPGGIIAPCATNTKEVVTNGWSPSKRDQPYANSGVVVELGLRDFAEYEDLGALSALEFQKDVEHKAWLVGGQSQSVPGQRMVDFTKSKFSQDLPSSSYIPGVTPANLKEVLPQVVHKSLKKAFKMFDQKMKGYFTNEALVHAPESRTSSPVRIPRDKLTLEHPQIKGLYPCGEGAGYAGGIVSASIDGYKCVEACCST